MKLYASITKTEAQEDGTLKVYGFASSGAEDSDGETVSPDAMKAAIPDYMKFGAVREMHQSIAAGTAIDISVDDQGKTNFAAHVVDPVAVKKVSTGTYKGFSIGGKVLKRDAANPKNITELRLVEVSLVDRPANPDAVFTMYKAEKTPEEIAAAAVELEKSAVADIASLINSKALSPSQILKAARDSLEATLKTPQKRKPLTFETFKKGMSSVANFAQLLQGAAWLASDAAYEAEYENDASKVPEGLRAWVAAGVECFQTMAAEEAAEMLAAIKQLPAATTEVAVIESAAATGDVAKAGAVFSAASKKKLGAIHAAMKDCCDKMDSLGYKDADDASMAASAEALKASQAVDLAKAAELGDLFKSELAKRDAVIDDLVKRLTTIEAQPAPTKAVLRVVGKGEEVGDVVKGDGIEIPDTATPEQRALLEIKKSFRTGGRPYTG
jgi:Caudovirus prohead serine protease